MDVETLREEGERGLVIVEVVSCVFVDRRRKSERGRMKVIPDEIGLTRL